MVQVRSILFTRHKEVINTVSILRSVQMQLRLYRCNSDCIDAPHTFVRVYALTQTAGQKPRTLRPARGARKKAPWASTELRGKSQDGPIASKQNAVDAHHPVFRSCFRLVHFFTVLGHAKLAPEPPASTQHRTREGGEGQSRFARSGAWLLCSRRPTGGCCSYHRASTPAAALVVASSRGRGFTGRETNHM